MARANAAERTTEGDQISRDDLAHAVKAHPKLDSSLSRIEKIREIAKGSFNRVDGVLVDSFTASGIVKVYDALNDVNKAKYEALPVKKMASVMWKLVK